MKRICILLVAMVMLLSGCNKLHSDKDDNLLATINNYDIYNSELEWARALNKNRNFTDSELLEGIILESLVLQQADKLDIEVSEEDVEDIISGLKDLGNNFYEKAIEIYRTEEKLREGYYNKILYGEAKNYIISEFDGRIAVDSNILQERTQDYVAQTDLSQIASVDQIQYIKMVEKEYQVITRNELSDLYFYTWQYLSARRSELYINSDRFKDVFQGYIYRLDGESFYINDEEYALETVDLNTYRDIWGSILYISDEFISTYGDIDVSFLHLPKQNVKVASIKFISDSSSIKEIVIMVAPRIVYDDDNNIDVLGQFSGSGTWDFVQQDLGIYYAIAGDADEKELGLVLSRMIPFTIAEE